MATDSEHGTRKKRVVVTGMGVCTCYGNDVEKFYENLLEGNSGISRITKFDAEEFSTKIAGEIRVSSCLTSSIKFRQLTGAVNATGL